MNKQTLLQLLAISFVFLHGTSYPFPFIGTVHLPDKQLDLPGIYCNGYRIPVETCKQKDNVVTLFEIDEQRTAPKISLILVAGAVKLVAKCSKQGKTIPSCLMVPKETEYQYFELKPIKATSSEQDQEEQPAENFTWSIEEKFLVENGRIPDDKTIIMLLAPSMFDGFENVTWAFNDNLIKLPAIKTKREKNTVKKMAIRLKMASIEMNAFHEPLPKNVKIRHGQHNLTITKAALNQCL